MPTLDSKDFLALSNLVAENGIRYFVETNANGSAEGLETAARLGLIAHVCDPNQRNATVLAQRYPQFDLYDGNAAEFLAAVIPKLDGPAFFLLTNELERRVVEIESEGKDWHFEMKDGVPETVTLAVSGRVHPDAIDENFDRMFAGPPELAPPVYRSQSEKDTWYAIVVENEYLCPTFQASDVVIDIGSNIGAFVKRAHMMGSREVYAFEPSRFYMEAAQQNVADLDGVHLHQLAVVRGDANRKPQYFHDGGMGTFCDEGNPVESVSLDEILADFEYVRFLKIDCEGGEWPILFSCKNLAKIQEIAGEYHLGPYLDIGETHISVLMGFLYEQGFTKATYVKNSASTGNFYAKR